ncbi:protein giant [Ischnura elegans]|uniref:protein giant n=1 Tax=Ischnura elegans TaxID=197161 RepID=UPI001ED8984C|nr:protein giant [Ischnura elegans]
MMTAVMPHPTPAVSSPTLSCPPFRFLRMPERREREEETYGHSVPRLPTPEEQREAAHANRSPLHTAEDSVPLDFSSRPTLPSSRTPDSGVEAGVVDLCTRGNIPEDRLGNQTTSADEEDRRNTSRGSSSDGSSMLNVSSDGSYPYVHHQVQHHATTHSPPAPTMQTYPIHPVALHPHQHHSFMVTPPAAPRQPSPPHIEVSSAPTTPGAAPSFPGILSLTPPPPVPLHTPLTGAVPLPLSPPQQQQQPTFPSLLPPPLHKTLAVAAASTTGGKMEPGAKVTRPFKAYPKDPLTLTVGVSTAESLLGQASNEAYVEFRKQMLQQVAATKARRPIAQPSQGQQQAEDQALQSPGETQSESCESQQQNAQSSASSGDEDSNSSGGKKRSRGNSESSNAPYPVVKDAAYWERRRKNNEAAKRSRDARRAKEDEIAIRAAFLEQENLKLKYEVAALRHETSNLRCLLYSAANGS